MSSEKFVRQIETRMLDCGLDEIELGDELDLLGQEGEIVFERGADGVCVYTGIDYDKLEKNNQLTREESNVLYHLCRYCVGILDSWHPYPSTNLSQQTGLNLYKTRKALKKLKEMGLVYPCREGGQDEDGHAFCCRGYRITKAAEATEEYKRAHEVERKICLEVFNMDIGGV